MPCQAHRLTVYLINYRDFILHLVERKQDFHEVVMNLPQIAVDFVDVFVGLGSRMGDR